MLKVCVSLRERRCRGRCEETDVNGCEWMWMECLTARISLDLLQSQREIQQAADLGKPSFWTLCYMGLNPGSQGSNMTRDLDVNSGFSRECGSRVSSDQGTRWVGNCDRSALQTCTALDLGQHKLDQMRQIWDFLRSIFSTFWWPDQIT